MPDPNILLRQQSVPSVQQGIQGALQNRLLQQKATSSQQGIDSTNQNNKKKAYYHAIKLLRGIDSPAERLSQGARINQEVERLYGVSVIDENGLGPEDVTNKFLDSNIEIFEGVLGGDVSEREKFEEEKKQFGITSGLSFAKMSESLKDKQEFKPKDIADINNKVTALTQDTREIVGSASSLEKLKNSSSPAAQLAAIFKFMKALDPASVVRQDEQGQVTGAQGAAIGFQNKLNSLLGKGQLDAKGFQDIVDTAKSLANVAIDNTGQEFDGFLGVIEENLTPKQMAKFKDRLPTPFEIEDGNIRQRAPASPRVGRGGAQSRRRDPVVEVEF